MISSLAFLSCMKGTFVITAKFKFNCQFTWNSHFVAHFVESDFQTTLDVIFE